MANNNTKVVAAVAQSGIEFTDRVLEGIASYIEQHPNLGFTDRTYAPGNAPDFNRKPDFDAALLWADKGDLWVSELLKRRLPLLSIGSDWPTSVIPHIAYSTESVYSMAVEHLISIGVREVIYAYNNMQSNETRKRLGQQFLKIAESKGVSARIFSIGEVPDIMLRGDHHVSEEVEEVIRQFLLKLEYPVGIHSPPRQYLRKHLSYSQRDGIIDT